MLALAKRARPMSTRTVPSSSNLGLMAPARVSMVNSLVGHAARLGQIAGEHADAVAAHLRLAAVGVEDAHAGDRAGDRARGSDVQQDAVGAHAKVPVTEQADGVRGQLARKRGLLDDEVIVAQSLPLGQLHAGWVSLI